MMKGWIARCGMVLLATCMACQSQASPCGWSYESAECEGSCREVMDGLAEFSSTLCQQLSVLDGDNFCVSPYSISTALSMAYIGSRRETTDSMAELLGYPGDLVATADAFYLLQGRLFGAASYELYPASSIWLQKGLDLQPSYVKLIQTNYCGEPFQVDFAKDSTGAVEEINGWVATQTSGKINELLHPFDIEGSTRLALVSALYLKAQWRSPFDPTLTVKAPFTVEDGTSVDVEMMHQTGFFNLYEGGGFRVVELPYVSKGEEELFMWILLPDRNDDLPALRAQLSNDLYRQIERGLKRERVDLMVPKFSIDFRVELSALLKGLGMEIPFSKTADFSGIDGTQNLQLEQVVHQAVIEVDEAGTTAAAATVVTISLKSAPPSRPPIEFHADHPFFYLVATKPTGLPFFTGRLVNPGQ